MPGHRPLSSLIGSFVRRLLPGAAELGGEDGEGGEEEPARELLTKAASTLVGSAPPEGVLGEGDTRSDDMDVVRRRAARRRLFAGCIEALRSAPEPLNPEQIFPCVDKTRATLFAPRGSNARAVPSRRFLRPIPARPRSIA